MGVVGATICPFCGHHCCAGKNRSLRDGLESCHGDSHVSHPRVHLGNCHVDQCAKRDLQHRSPVVDLLGAFRFSHRFVMALLFSRTPAWSSFSRCTDRQAECRFRDSLCCRFSWRANNRHKSAGRILDRRGRNCIGLGVTTIQRQQQSEARLPGDVVRLEVPEVASDKTPHKNKYGEDYDRSKPYGHE